MLWALLLLCLTQLVVSVVFYVATSTWLLDQVDHSLLVTATQISTVISEQGNTLQSDHVNFQFDESTPTVQAFLRDQHFFVRLIDRQSGLVLDASNPNDVPVPSLKTSAVPHLETLVVGGHSELRIYTLPLPQNEMIALQVGMSLNQLRSTQTQVLRLLTAAFGLTVVFALAGGWFIGTRALAPIRGVTRTARNIKATDLTRRLDLKSSDDELEQLVQTFNAMLDRIEEAFRQQRRFTTDAAHELRTPLSIMRTGLDVVLSQDRSAEEFRSVLESTREEVQRLTELANGLLMLVRADTHELPLNNDWTDLSLLLQTVVDQLEVLAADKQIELQREVPPHIRIYGDQDRLIQVALNLIDNAIKYTPEGGQVRVTARSYATVAEFTIVNSGPPIADDELKHIFDRFYRIERSRNRDRGGFGLGLAIVKQIVELHGGTISVDSILGRGTTFTVQLPAGQ